MAPMPKRLLGMVLAAALFAPAGGCIVHTKPGHSHHAVKSKHKHKKGRCKPSQYWDGHHCRHKGKGKGARKHDD